MVAIPWRFKSSYPHHVAADGISFAATFLQKSLLTHSVAAPLRNEPVIAGLRFGFLPEWGIFFVNASHVGASFVSLAPIFLQKSERTYAAAPPLRKKSRLLRPCPCKRGHCASAALPTFCGMRKFKPIRQKRKYIFFIELG